MDAGRIKGILLNPKDEWPVISQEYADITDLYKSFILILAAIGPVASIIGLSIVGVNLPYAGSFRVPITSSLTSGIVNYVLSLAGVFVLAYIIDALAPTFNGQKSLKQAFKVAAYSSIPGWLAGIFVLVPALGVLSIVGLYGIYLLFLGLPLLMKSPQEKSVAYTVTVIIAAIVIFILIGTVSRSFVSYPAANISLPKIQ